MIGNHPIETTIKNSKQIIWGKVLWGTYSNQHNKQIEELLAALFSNNFAKGIFL